MSGVAYKPLRSELTSAQACETEARFIANRRGHRLLIHQTPAVGTSAAIAVICPPFSEEKQKSYRAHYHLARKLSQRGVSCFRFDYAGCGDSDGDFIDTTIQSMIDDACDVINYAGNASTVNELYVLGTRLGGTIAALATERLADVSGLGLMFPVIDGSRYWADVLRQQQMADLSAGLKPAPRSKLAQHLAEHGSVEVESNLVSTEMVRQLSETNLCRSIPKIGCRVFAASLQADQKSCQELHEFLGLLENSASDTIEFVSREDEFWTLSALYGNYRPTDTFERLGEWLRP